MVICGCDLPHTDVYVVVPRYGCVPVVTLLYVVVTYIACACYGYPLILHIYSPYGYLLPHTLLHYVARSRYVAYLCYVVGYVVILHHLHSRCYGCIYQPHVHCVCLPVTGRYFTFHTVRCHILPLHGYTTRLPVRCYRCYTAPRLPHGYHTFTRSSRFFPHRGSHVAFTHPTVGLLRLPFTRLFVLQLLHVGLFYLRLHCCHFITTNTTFCHLRTTRRYHARLPLPYHGIDSLYHGLHHASPLPAVACRCLVVYTTPLVRFIP